jgi:hypothetical protein
MWNPECCKNATVLPLRHRVGFRKLNEFNRICSRWVARGNGSRGSGPVTEEKRNDDDDE